MKKPTQPPIGFGRKDLPDEADQDPAEKQQQEEKPAEPPLAPPIFLEDTAVYEFLFRYGLNSLAPLSKFEYQLLCVAAGLEQRVRELQ